MQLGDAERAIVAFEQADTLKQNDFPTLAGLAEARRDSGDREGALAAVRKAARCRADDRGLSRVYRLGGELYLAADDHDRAVRELRKAAALSDPEQLDLLGLLGQAQVGAGDLAGARTNLSRAATASPPPREVLLMLCDVLLELGEPDEARMAPMRLLEQDPADIEARCAMARVLLSCGDLAGARRAASEALDRDAQLPEAHRLLGRAHAEAGDRQTAVEHLRKALDLNMERRAFSQQRTVEVLELAVALQIEEEPTPEALATLATDARRLLYLRPRDPLALAGMGMSKIDELDAALSLVQRSLAREETFAGLLVAGLVHQFRAEHGEAAVALRRALRLRPGNLRARTLLQSACRDRAGFGPEHAELYPLLGAVHRLLGDHAALAPLAPEVARLREVFDSPLLVCVMGEFNSGKSTFVNALIGEKVAPMGITPTTATINVLKYGEQRSARVVRRDNTEQVLSWDEVERFLAGLSDEQARAVERVELLFPSEELLRVNVVDTPGLNSLVDSHEQAARQILAQADAVVWLFSAGQAGKQTEQEALDLLHKHRPKTVGVLNKVDRLSDDELAEVMTHLRQSFADFVDQVLPVATRTALDAQLSHNSEALTRSRFPALRAHLEQQLFTRSRQLKAAASRDRLVQVLERAVTGLEQDRAAIRRATDRLERLDSRRAGALDRSLVDEERDRLDRGLDELYQVAAEEVLDVVRPRSWALGDHQASAADRDFLMDLLLDGLRQLTEASLDTVQVTVGELSRAIGTELDAAAADHEPGDGGVAAAAVRQVLGERLRLLDQQVYGRVTAYTRGYLDGGLVDRFFERKLPRLALHHDAVVEALAEEPLALERELLGPLSRWVEEVAVELGRRLEAVRREAEFDLLELECGFLQPLSRLCARLKAEGTP